MKYYGKAELITTENRKVEYIRCDSCNKKLLKKYYDVRTGHHDWGNDSIDSIEHKDICEKCINSYVANYLEDVKSSNTAYIDVETEYFSFVRFGDYNSWEDRLVENDKNED